VLKFISIGNYSTGLYLNGSLQYSSYFGGLMTILVGVVFLDYSGVILSNTLHGNKYLTLNSIEDLIYSDYTKDITLGQF
jgi:hypothetical protein